jgi:hypothetical protein
MNDAVYAWDKGLNYSKLKCEQKRRGELKGR